MRRMLLIAPITLFFAGCSAAPAPSTATPAPVITTAASSAPADPDGLAACRSVKKAADADEMRSPGVVEAIAEAGGRSTNTSVRLAALMLSDRYELAAAAVGTQDEVSTSVELLTAAIKMQTACLQAGLSE